MMTTTGRLIQFSFAVAFWSLILQSSVFDRPTNPQIEHHDPTEWPLRNRSKPFGKIWQDSEDNHKHNKT